MNQNAAWDHAVKLYARPRVAAELLRRQDEEGLDIVLHLFTEWLRDERGLTLDPAQLQEAETHVRHWREQVIQPLRAARRAAKSEGPAGSQRDALRERIQIAELDAERVQMSMLCTWLETVRATPSSP